MCLHIIDHLDIRPWSLLAVILGLYLCIIYNKWWMGINESFMNSLILILAIHAIQGLTGTDDVIMLWRNRERQKGTPEDSNH